MDQWTKLPCWLFAHSSVYHSIITMADWKTVFIISTLYAYVSGNHNLVRHVNTLTMSCICFPVDFTTLSSLKCENGKFSHLIDKKELSCLTRNLYMLVIFALHVSNYMPLRNISDAGMQ